MIGSLGPTEILIILFIVLLIFGGKKLPELARGLGKGIREFKDATHKVDEEIRELDKPESKSEKTDESK